MEKSDAVRDSLLEFYDRLSAKDLASFDRLVSSSDAALVIGTSPGEWVTDRAGLRYGFEAEGMRIEPGAPVGFEEGTIGWVADEPTFFFPDGSGMRTRLTAVLRREDERWKLVHMHVSVGVPDEEVLDLQRSWGTAP
jgi:hypothetical protein